ncbi:MAG: hypothetical protein R2880_11835 [Deinococcales bacterium]
MPKVLCQGLISIGLMFILGSPVLAGDISGSYEFAVSWSRHSENNNFFLNELVSEHKLNLNMSFGASRATARGYLKARPGESLSFEDVELSFRDNLWQAKLFFNLKEGELGDLLNLSQNDGWDKGNGIRFGVAGFDGRLARLNNDTHSDVTAMITSYKTPLAAGLALIFASRYQKEATEQYNAGLELSYPLFDQQVKAELALSLLDETSALALEAQAYGPLPVSLPFGLRYSVGFRHVPQDFRAYLSKRFQDDGNKRFFDELWRENSQMEIYYNLESSDLSGYTFKFFGDSYAGSAGRSFIVGLEGWKNELRDLRPYGKVEYGFQMASGQNDNQQRLNTLLEMAWYGQLEPFDLSLKGNVGLNVRQKGIEASTLTTSIYGEVDARSNPWRLFGKVKYSSSNTLTAYLEGNLNLGRFTLKASLGEGDFDSYNSLQYVLKVATVVSF